LLSLVWRGNTQPWVCDDLAPFLFDQRYARAGPRSVSDGLFRSLSPAGVPGFPSVSCRSPFAMTALTVIPPVVGAHVESRFYPVQDANARRVIRAIAIAIAMAVADCAGKGQDSGFLALDSLRLRGSGMEGSLGTESRSHHIEAGYPLTAFEVLEGASW